VVSWRWRGTIPTAEPPPLRRERSP
jgi:autotrns_rpt: autotransporter-associated beta strand repeat